MEILSKKRDLIPGNLLHLMTVLFILLSVRPDHVSTQDAVLDIIKVTSIEENSISIMLEGRKEWMVDYYNVMMTYHPLIEEIINLGLQSEEDIPFAEQVNITYRDLLSTQEFLVEVNGFDRNDLLIIDTQKIVRTLTICYVCNGKKSNRGCSADRNKILCQPDEEACMNVVEYRNGNPRITKSCVKWTEDRKEDLGCLGKPRNGVCRCLCKGHECNKQMMPCVPDFTIHRVSGTEVTIDPSELDTETNYIIEILLLPWNQPLHYQRLLQGELKTFGDLLPSSNYTVRVSPVNRCLERPGPPIEKLIHTSQFCYSCTDSKGNNACSGERNTIECSPDEDACLNIVQHVNGIRSITKRCAKWNPNHEDVTTKCTKRPCVCMCRGNLCNERALPCIGVLAVTNVTERSITYEIIGTVKNGDSYRVTIDEVDHEVTIMSIQTDEPRNITFDNLLPGVRYRAILQLMKKDRISREDAIITQTLMKCYVCENSIDEKDCDRYFMECPIGTNACLGTITYTELLQLLVTKRCAVSLPSIPSPCRKEYGQSVCYDVCAGDLCNTRSLTYFEDEDILRSSRCLKVLTISVKKRIPGRIQAQVVYLTQQPSAEQVWRAQVLHK